MKFRDTIITSVCILVGAGLLLQASTGLDKIRQARQDMGLVSNTVLDNAPPSLAFATVAMGAFRGLVVDILWIRADNLKEKGQFFDAKQLADWITVLQPRFASVWEFQAWNMAYNISVTFPASQWQERWQWVKNGIELLRDKGIVENPKAISLYRYLAWIFQHKIGGVTDDCHKDYKRELALAMRSLLGENPDKQYFEKLAKSPQTLQEILKDPETARMIDTLKKEDKAFDTDDDGIIRAYLALRKKPDDFTPKAREVIDLFSSSETLDNFDIFAKAYLLRHDWKMKPDYMIKLNNKYGPVTWTDPNDHMPLNWEHPDAHAIYWAQLGLDIAGKKGQYSVDEKNTDRIIFHGLQSLFRSGKIIIYPIPGELPSVFLRPDLRMFDVCNKAWIERIEKYENLEHGNPKAVKGGHKNMLINSALMFYQAGHKDKAGRIYQELRKRYPYKDFNVPLAVFIHKRLTEEIQQIDINDAREMIIMYLHSAFFNYAIHDDDQASGQEQWAKEVYDIYQKQFGDEEVRRIDLTSFEMMRFLGFVSFMNDDGFRPEIRSKLLQRIQTEKPELYKKLMAEKDMFMKQIQQAQQQNQQQN